MMKMEKWENLLYLKAINEIQSDVQTKVLGVEKIRSGLRQR